MIAKNTILLEGSEGSQVAESKYKKIISRDKERYWPPRKLKGSIMKMPQSRWGVLISVRGM